jgi:hypothetical protein
VALQINDCQNVPDGLLLAHWSEGKEGKKECGKYFDKDKAV